ncbi:hypothetical protein QLX08_009230 [Tetragonisca angustula]|uniref:Transposase n=1 Tax=Tetragonisca angustula TaxID=166442 RepID=A0AAW0ZGY3_9HYME
MRRMLAERTGLPCTHFDSLKSLDGTINPRNDGGSMEQANGRTSGKDSVLKRKRGKYGGKSCWSYDGVRRRGATILRAWSTYGDRNNRETQAVYVYHVAC